MQFTSSTLCKILFKVIKGAYLIIVFVKLVMILHVHEGLGVLGERGYLLLLPITLFGLLCRNHLKSFKRTTS